MASEFQDDSNRFIDYITPTDKIFNLIEVSYREILKLIQEIPNNKASDLDNIFACLLKEAAPIVTHSLTFIINLSFITGIFPDAWKLARVYPYF